MGKLPHKVSLVHICVIAKNDFLESLNAVRILACGGDFCGEGLSRVFTGAVFCDSSLPYSQ